MSDSDSEIEVNTPPDIINTAMAAASNLLPAKSRQKYEKAYRDFIKWKKLNHHTKSMSEKVILSYFTDLSKKFNPASLWTIYSMLKSTLNIKHKVDVAKYCKLTDFLKRVSKGYKAKKAKIFSPEEINKFLNEAPDILYLQIKVGLIFGIMGACRRQELYNLQFSDVQCFDKTILVTIRNANSETNRTFTITGSYSDLCKKYIELRPSDCSERSFFLYYSAGKCTKQKMGINKLGNLGHAIAQFLNLPNPELYTGHCFRRTSEHLLLDAGEDVTTLKQHGGWKCTTAEGCIDQSIQHRIKVSNQIINTIQNKQAINMDVPSASDQDPPSPTPQEEGLLQITVKAEQSDNEESPPSHVSPPNLADLDKNSIENNGYGYARYFDVDIVDCKSNNIGAKLTDSTKVNQCDSRPDPLLEESNRVAYLEDQRKDRCFNSHQDTSEVLKQCCAAILSLTRAMNSQTAVISEAIKAQGDTIAEALREQGKMISDALAKR